MSPGISFATSLASMNEIGCPIWKAGAKSRFAAVSAMARTIGSRP